MNIRCSFCQTPYTLGRVQMIDALQEMNAQDLTHYDAHCPRCRRATPVQRQRLEMAMPNWREELKKFEKELKENPPQAAEAEPAKQAAREPEVVPAKAETKAKSTSKKQTSPPPAARLEEGSKAPAKNTPAQGKKKAK